ncbi:hypothetical protein DRO32_00190 [Candidatus Bathyarchaeota archaeon]|nr:MAG: hypothetical protein DRO32_00190 [Candidatus Bathyarchaeota archaeon]
MRADLVEEVSDIGRVVEELKKSSGDVGAVCIFIGVVRGTSRGRRVLGLHYEAHGELAPKVLLELLEEARTRYGILDGIIEHKIGSAFVGEPVMCVAVASRHRLEGFRALMDLVDEVKKRAPIWKKEITEEGEYWVEEAGPSGPLIRLRTPLEAEVNVRISAGELVMRLGLRPGEVSVVKDGEILEGHEELREGDLIRIVPSGAPEGGR